MGGNTTFGSVMKLPGGFVKKMMAIGSRTNSGGDLLKIFLNEIRVGSLPGIKEVGPKIYAWKVNRDARGEIQSAEYIMDDFTVAPAGQKVLMMKDYAKVFDACPAKGHAIYTKLKEAILKFWRITKGYHGDLHVGNMAVRYDVLTHNPIKVIIFDYGSHKKFKTTTNATTCFEEYIKIIDKEFANRYAKKTVNKAMHPAFSSIRTVFGQRGQPIRPNTNLLRNTSLIGGYRASNSGERWYPRNVKAFGMKPNNTNILTGLRNVKSPVSSPVKVPKSNVNTLTNRIARLNIQNSHQAKKPRRRSGRRRSQAPAKPKWNLNWHAL